MSLENFKERYRDMITLRKIGIADLIFYTAPFLLVSIDVKIAAQVKYYETK